MVEISNMDIMSVGLILWQYAVLLIDLFYEM